MNQPQPEKKAPARKQGKGRRRATRGILWIIAALLLTSGVIRLTGTAGQALARGMSELAADTPQVEPQACQQEPDIATVLTALKEREAKLQAREAALDNRLQALDLAEARVRQNLAALEQAEQRLRSTMAIADTAAEDDLARLTAVYENMKPKEAAALFEAMDPEFAAGFLGRMRPDAAAAIMAGLPPQAGYSISVILAGRNANAGKN